MSKSKKNLSYLDDFVMSIELDAKGFISKANRQFLKISKYTEKGILGKHFNNLIFDAGKDLLGQKIWKIISGGKSWEGEIKNLDRDGSFFWTETKIYPVVEGRARPIKYLVAQFPITRCKIIEEQMTEESNFMQVLWTAAVSANESLNVEEALRTAVNSVCVLMNWPVGHALFLADDRKEFISSKIWYFDAPAKFADFRNISEQAIYGLGHHLLGTALATGKVAWSQDVGEYANFAARYSLAKKLDINGSLVSPILVGKEVLGMMEFFAPEIHKPSPGVIKLLTQVGLQIGRVMERKRMEVRLLDSVGDGILAIDRSWNITIFNQAATKISGWKKEEVI
ncbi:MAG TPA: PAS domain S-box protein, partial [Patescibacteria group bacterium]